METINNSFPSYVWGDDIRDKWGYLFNSERHGKPVTVHILLDKLTWEESVFASAAPTL